MLQSMCSTQLAQHIHGATSHMAELMYNALLLQAPTQVTPLKKEAMIWKYEKENSPASIDGIVRSHNLSHGTVDVHNTHANPHTFYAYAILFCCSILIVTAIILQI